MSNPLGIQGTMRERPLVPLVSIACIAYPEGGVRTPGQPGCTLGLRVQNKRTSINRGQRVTVMQYLTVTVWAQASDVPTLAAALGARPWDAIMLWRKPTALYDQLIQALPATGPWRQVPEEWTPDVMVSLSNAMLARLPLSSTPEFIGACESRPIVRHAFACVLAAVGEFASGAAYDARPIGRTPHRGTWYGPGRPVDANLVGQVPDDPVGSNPEGEIPYGTL